MTSRQDLVVRFIGDTGHLDRSAGQVTNRLQGVATGLKAIAAAGAAVGAVSFFQNAIQGARDAAKVGRETEAVLRSTSGVANATAESVANLAEKLALKSGVDDELIQSGANVLLTFTRVRNEMGSGNDVYDRGVELALDMSVALKSDLQSSILMVGKALNDPIKGMTAMTRAGIQFTAQQKDQIRALVESGDLLGAQKIILGELRVQFGGMAEASADAGDKLRLAWENLSEEIGGHLMPAFTAVSTWALNTGIPALSNVASTTAGVVAPAFNGLVNVGTSAIRMFQGLPGPIQAGVVALAAWRLVGDHVTGMFGRMSGPLKGFGSDVRMVMQASQGDVGRFGASMQVLQDRIPTLGAMGTAFRTARGDADGFGGTLRGVASAAGVGLRGAMSGLVGFLGGPWGVAIAAATIGIGMIVSNSQRASAEQKRMADAGREVAQSLREQNGAINEVTRASAAKKAEDTELLRLAQQLGFSLPNVVDAILGQGDAYDRLMSSAQSMIGVWKSQIELSNPIITAEKGNAEQMLANVDTAEKFRAKLAELVGGKDSDFAATQRVTAATQMSTGAVAALSGAQGLGVASTALYMGILEQAGMKMEGTTVEASQLADAIRKITTEQQTAIETEEAYEAALDELTVSIQTNGATLDIHTEKGRANRDALEKTAMAIRDRTLADIESGVPMTEALNRHNQRIDALQREAVRAFGTTGETRVLIDTYGRIPRDVETLIRTTGYEETMAKLDTLSRSQRALAMGVSVRELSGIERNVPAAQRAHGGPISGPGGPRSDAIPAWLSNGEFVHQASAVDYYGRGLMSAINARRIPKEALRGFAAGGMVWPFDVDVTKTKIPEMPAAFAGGAPGSLGMIQQWAWAQRGKRYQWGAVGPGTYDCSGLVGAIWALAHGLPPHRRYMTTATMGVGRHGMKAGPGPITVYLGPGHTAANIGGLHAEAYGGNGTPLAIGRIGTRLGFYNRIMHMAQGGLAQLKNSPGLRMMSFLEKGWPEPVGYRNGGVLRPGGLAYNETGQDEYVLNRKQMESRPVEKHYHLTIYSTNSDVDLRTQFRRMEILDGGAL